MEERLDGPGPVLDLVHLVYEEDGLALAPRQGTSLVPFDGDLGGGHSSEAVGIDIVVGDARGIEGLLDGGRLSGLSGAYDDLHEAPWLG